MAEVVVQFVLVDFKVLCLSHSVVLHEVCVAHPILKLNFRVEIALVPSYLIYFMVALQSVIRQFFLQSQ